MPDLALQLDEHPTPRPSRLKALLGFAAAVMALLAFTVTPAHAFATTAIREVDGDLVGSDPNFIGVIPSSGVCSWKFNVAGQEQGIVYSALDCSRPSGRTHALVGTNPASGCNDARVCEFLEKSSIVWR